MGDKAVAQRAAGKEAAPVPHAPRRPNLLFLMTDQQRADTIAQGGPCLTPNLQALARAGADLRRCYAPNPICSPTRASLFTGLLPHAHGMTDVTHAVPPQRAELVPDLPFWTQRLKAAGYRTGYFGKWHVERSDRLEQFGIDEYQVDLRQTGVVSHAGPLEPRITIDQPGYQQFLLAGVSDTPAGRTREAELVDLGIDFLERVTAQRATKLAAGAAPSGEPGSHYAATVGAEAGAVTREPWALFISTEAPHDPYVVPRELYDRYDPTATSLPASFGDDLADKPHVYARIREAWRDLSETEVRQAITCYHAACSGIDDQFGRVLAALERSGQAEDTLVVFTSDHGDYLGAHGLFLKGVAPFEEAYRVPLLLRGPGIAPGTVIDEPVSLIDLGRTLTRLLLDEDFGGHGRDLSAVVRGGEPAADAGVSVKPGTDASTAAGGAAFASDHEPQAFAEFHGQRLGYTQRIIWRGDHKYVFNGFDRDELYDLANDPHELVNLAGQPQHQALLVAMAAAMWREVRRTGDTTLGDAQYGMFRFAPVGPHTGGSLDGAGDTLGHDAARNGEDTHE